MMEYDTLIEMVKAAGQDLFYRAEELVGHSEGITDFDIWIRFPQGRDLPTIEVTKSVVSTRAVEVMKRHLWGE